jgi:hypothetical protein
MTTTITRNTDKLRIAAAATRAAAIANAAITNAPATAGN